MNCKQGDLAVVVRSFAGNDGRIVRCLRLIGEKCWMRPDGTMNISPTWLIDVELEGFNGSKGNDISDALLRPIRDPGDGAIDETLGWKRVPSAHYLKEAA